MAYLCGRAVDGVQEARLIDVATRAGVSLRTASRVLNNDARVAGATRSRVQDAIRELDFAPDIAARSLRAGTDTAIGLVVESIADPFFADMIDAAESEFARCGRSVLVASTHRDPQTEQSVIRRMTGRRVAGLLVVPTGLSGWADAVTGPVVLVDRGFDGGFDGVGDGNGEGYGAGCGVATLTRPMDLVDIDDRRAAHDAVAHLIGHGHRRIAHLGDSNAIATSAARLRGYRDALSEHGIEADPALEFDCAATSADAAAVVTRLLEPRAGTPRTAVTSAPTAIFSATTRASLGAVPVLHALGRTDLAFVGLGDFAMADALVPGITVIDHSGHRAGIAAAQRLLSRLADPDQPAQHVRLAAPLIARGAGELRP